MATVTLVQGLGSLFTLINPEIARASHRQILGSVDPKAVKLLVDQALGAFTARSFAANGVAINLSTVAVPEDVVSSSRDAAQEQVNIAVQELADLKQLVDVARNIEPTRSQQRQVEAELAECTRKLREHAEHLKEYSERPRIGADVKTLRDSLAAKREEVRSFDRDEAAFIQKLEDLQSIAGDLDHANQLRTAISNQLSEVQIGQIAEQYADTVPEAIDATLTVAELAASLGDACGRLARISQQLTELQDRRFSATERLRTIQQRIAIESRRRGGRTAVFDQDAEQDWADLANLRNALGDNEQRIQMLWEAMFKQLAMELDLLRRSVAEVKKRATRINSDLKRYKVSNLESVEIHIDHDTREYAVIERMTAKDSMFLSVQDIADAKRELQQWITDGKTIELRDIFTVRIRIQNQGELRPVDVASIDEIGSQGTGVTAKVMIYLQLLRSIIDDEKNEFQMHFYLDEIGTLDERNVHATTEMAVRRGFIPITAEPEPRAEALAHPEVLIYHLGTSGKHFEIIHKLTYKARAKTRREGVPAS